jgi:hypothetical protein
MTMHACDICEHQEIVALESDPSEIYSLRIAKIGGDLWVEMDLCVRCASHVKSKIQSVKDEVDQLRKDFPGEISNADTLAQLSPGTSTPLVTRFAHTTRTGAL